MICVSSFITFLTNVIPDEPGFIVGPISWVLGVILNFVFNVVYFITENFSLGITIIVVTIIARVLMLPLSFKQQKSMVVMRKIQPEIKKIQDKYKDDMADPEVKRKMNTEMQKLYSQNNYNPLSGCLPLLIQLPIFIALYYIMQNSYAFIDTINDSYMEISNVIVQEVSEDKESGSKLLEQREEVLKIKQKNEGERSDREKELISNYDSNKFIFWYEFSKNDIYPMIPEDMKNPEPDSGDEEFNTLKPEHMVKAFDKLSSSQWKKINDVFKNDKIEENLIKKENIEYFGPGINLTEVAGIGFPGVIITLLSGITTFLSSWLMTRKNKDMGGAASQQKIMMITMPLIMAWITSGLPCGVGLYWITSNIFMIAQQQILNKYYENKLSLEEDKLNKVIDENPKSKNGKKSEKQEVIFMKSVEVIGKTKEEAISGALSRLDAVIDDVLVEVIEEGSRGFLGIGSKPFKVKVTKKTNPVKVAKDFLREIFVAIELSVDVKCDFLDEKNLEINLSGENMGVIIGKRGQTLDALQYLTSIIVNKNDDKFVNVTMNTEFYREKRKETLENLAMSLARKAKHLRKDIVLEPMNSSERRIIHSTLQNDKYVTTHSEGEGIYRYIIISPKEEYRNSYSGEYKKSYGGGYRGGYKEGRKEGYKESYSGKYDYKSGYKSYKTYSNKGYKSDYFKDDYKSDDDSGTATDVDYEIE